MSGSTEKCDIIFVDCDGVLLNWITDFDNWMTGMGFIRKDITQYSIGKRFGIPDFLAKDYVRQFNESVKAYFLGTVDGAYEAVNYLHQTHGVKFVVVTSFSDCVYANCLRRELLENIFGKEKFVSINCLGFAANKYTTLNRLKSFYGSYLKKDMKGTFWLEDLPDNVRDGNKLGFSGVLFDCPYNKSDQHDLTTVSSWQEFIRLYESRKTV